MIVYPSRAMNGDQKFSGPWMIAAVFLTFGISTGLPYYNISFFYDYFRDGHGWTQELVTMGAPLAVLLSIWVGPVIVPRVSPRLLIIIGTGMTFGAFQWFGRLSGNPYEYYAAWCLYMFGYFLSGPIPHQIIISNWYKQRRGRAMGIAYVGVAIIGWAGTQIGPQLASQMEYTEALKMMSFILLAAWPVALFVIKDKPEDVGQYPDGIAPTAAAVEETAVAPEIKEARSFSFMMSKPSFWLLTLGSAASIGSIACVTFLMKFIFEEQGFVEQVARDQVWADAAGYFLLSSIGGRLLAGFLADKFPRKWVMLATYAVVALSIPLLFLVTPDNRGFVYVFAVVFGFAMGADYMLIPLMAADQFGLASLPRAMSAIVPSDTLTQFWFPRMVAELRVVWGGYGSALWAVFGMAALGAAAIAMLPRHNRPSDEPPA
jgi:MFS family permease